MPPAHFHFFVLNMNKTPERYEVIKRSLDKLGCGYSRVEAIDGQTMEMNLECIQILYPRKEKIGQEFKCPDFNQTWIYDGSIRTSFPGISLGGHGGHKGLIVTNMKVFKEILTCDYQWNCVLEDDAIIDDEVYQKIIDFIRNPENQNVDVVSLDWRGKGFGGSAGVLYNRKCVSRLFIDLHPTSDFSISFHETYGFGTLWDWKLYRYMTVQQEKNVLQFRTLPCVKSGLFDSTIN